MKKTGLTQDGNVAGSGVVVLFGGFLFVFFGLFVFHNLCICKYTHSVFFI